MSDHHVCIHLATSRRNEVFHVEFVSETKATLSRLTSRQCCLTVAVRLTVVNQLRERDSQKKRRTESSRFPRSGDDGDDSVRLSHLRRFEMYSHLPMVHTVRRGYTCSRRCCSSSERLATVTAAPLCSDAPFSPFTTPITFT